VARLRHSGLDGVFSLVSLADGFRYRLQPGTFDGDVRVGPGTLVGVLNLVEHVFNTSHGSPSHL